METGEIQNGRAEPQFVTALAMQKSVRSTLALGTDYSTVQIVPGISPSRLTIFPLRNFIGLFASCDIIPQRQLHLPTDYRLPTTYDLRPTT